MWSFAQKLPKLFKVSWTSHVNQNDWHIYRISIFLMVVSDGQKLSKSRYLAKLKYTNSYNILNGAPMNLYYTP